jgi:hexosaminidase
MALVHQVTLPANDTIVMYVVFHYSLLAFVLTSYIRVWISSQNAAAVAAKGLKVVHSPSDYFYLVTINLFLNRLLF